MTAIREYGTTKERKKETWLTSLESFAPLRRSHGINLERGRSSTGSDRAFHRLTCVLALREKENELVPILRWTSHGDFVGVRVASVSHPLRGRWTFFLMVVLGSRKSSRTPTRPRPDWHSRVASFSDGIVGLAAKISRIPSFEPSNT